VRQPGADVRPDSNGMQGRAAGRFVVRNRPILAAFKPCWCQLKPRGTGGPGERADTRRGRAPSAGRDNGVLQAPCRSRRVIALQTSLLELGFRGSVDRQVSVLVVEDEAPILPSFAFVFSPGSAPYAICLNRDDRASHHGRQTTLRTCPKSPADPALAPQTPSPSRPPATTHVARSA